MNNPQKDIDITVSGSSFKEPIKFEWEGIADYTCRARVLGGWLVRTIPRRIKNSGIDALGTAMVFIPDPLHEWQVAK